MADVVDDAQAYQELSLKVALSNKRLEPPRPMGECYLCGEDEEIDAGASFCCRECAELWERKQRGLGYRL